MIRVRDLRSALHFFCEGLGLREVRRRDSEQGRYTLVFLGEGADGDSPQLADAIQLDNMASTWVYRHREVATAEFRNDGDHSAAEVAEWVASSVQEAVS